MEEYVDELIEWVRTEVKPMTKAEIKRIRAEAYRTSPELQKLGKEVKTLEMVLRVFEKSA